MVPLAASCASTHCMAAAASPDPAAGAPDGASSPPPPAKRVRFEDALAQVEEDDGDLPSAVFSDNPIVSEVKLEAESPRFPEAMIAAAMMVPSPIEASPAVKPTAPAMTVSWPGGKLIESSCRVGLGGGRR